MKYRTKMVPVSIKIWPTLTNAQTLWRDLAVFAGRDSGARKCLSNRGREMLLELAAGC
jgi:hypothetical protein